jgi:outer membrane protein OmpA-like peptidoglycan-associated protein
LFGRVGSGVIRYQSERTVLNDDQSLISASKGEALKSSLGIGLEYRFKEQWSVLFDASFYRVDNENFDAWNDGLGNSKYYVTAVGIKYDLAKSSKSRKEEVLDHKKEIRRKIKAYNEANIEPRLQSIESKIANHSHQNKTEDKVVEQNEASDKLNHHFFFDKSEHLVSINSLERVIDIADFMKANTEYKAKITGYADSDAGNILNDKLSQKRAENIKKYLVSLGVNANRISTFYKGETSPLAPNDSQLNKQLNRRVDVLLSK